MDIPTHAQLVERIDLFLARHAMAPSRFGRESTGEPNLVTSIREGRSPNLDTLNKLARFMTEQDARLDGGGEADSRRPFASSSCSAAPRAEAGKLLDSLAAAARATS